MIPCMAMDSNGYIGLLPTASFCEQCNSVAKDVVTDAHILIAKEAQGMLGVLQMNCVFMKHMQINIKI